MSSQTYVPDGIREEIELARALTALFMAVKLHCAESEDDAPTPSLFPDSLDES